MNTRTCIYFLITFLLFTSCSSVITITSTPDKADVHLRKLSSGTSKKIGTTPLTVNSSDISKDYDVDGPLYIDLKKDGYATTSAIVTDFSFRDIQLKLVLEAKNLLAYSTEVDGIINDLFEAQKLIRKNNLNDARLILNNIKKKHPYLSIIYEFEGGIHVVNKEFIKALDLFKVAIKYNSNNVEALRLKRAIEKKLNLKDTGSVPTATQQNE
ncbi:MAG: hypothetical protein ISR65_10425 [Bacteriovoracaceae bacterium]|nr:hypothetical protein [Bacteriovoracaceae bacterium]